MSVGLLTFFWIPKIYAPRRTPCWSGAETKTHQDTHRTGETLTSGCRILTSEWVKLPDILSIYLLVCLAVSLSVFVRLSTLQVNLPSAPFRLSWPEGSRSKIPAVFRISRWQFVWRFSLRKWRESATDSIPHLIILFWPNRFDLEGGTKPWKLNDEFSRKNVKQPEDFNFRVWWIQCVRKLKQQFNLIISPVLLIHPM